MVRRQLPSNPVQRSNHMTHCFSAPSCLPSLQSGEVATDRSDYDSSTPSLPSRLPIIRRQPDMASGPFRLSPLASSNRPPLGFFSPGRTHAVSPTSLNRGSISSADGFLRTNRFCDGQSQSGCDVISPASSSAKVTANMLLSHSNFRLVNPLEIPKSNASSSTTIGSCGDVLKTNSDNSAKAVPPIRVRVSFDDSCKKPSPTSLAALFRTPDDIDTATVKPREVQEGRSRSGGRLRTPRGPRMAEDGSIRREDSRD